MSDNPQEQDMAVFGVELPSDQIVLTRGRDFRWTFRKLGLGSTKLNPIYEDFPAGDLYFELQTGGAQNAIQAIEVTGADGGTYTLAKDGIPTAAMPFGLVTHAPVGSGNPDIQGALEAVTGIGAGNVLVHPASLYPVWEFDLTLNSGTNEVQNIEFGSTFGVLKPTGGNFKIGLGLQATPVIAFGAAPSVVTTALETMSNIGAGNVSVTATATGGYRVEFVGAKADTNMAQMVGYAEGIDLTLPTWSFGLTGALFPQIIVKTLVDGTPRFSDELINTLDTAFTTFFSSFDSLLGVDIELTVTDALNAVLKVTSLRAFDENAINTLAVDVTSDSIFGLLNNVAALVGVFETVHVNYYMNRFYQVEFIGDLALTPVDTLVANTSLLTGVNPGEVAVDVSTVQAGTPVVTKWDFTIAGDTATMFIPNTEADPISDRTLWQLVFKPSSGSTGGDAVAEGYVRRQPR
jgi:hypothetical protein